MASDREKALEEADRALDYLWSAIGDRLLANGPLSEAYAHEVAREIRVAQTRLRAALALPADEERGGIAEAMRRGEDIGYRRGWRECQRAAIQWICADVSDDLAADMIPRMEQALVPPGAADTHAKEEDHG